MLTELTARSCYDCENNSLLRASVGRGAVWDWKHAEIVKLG